MGIQWDSVLARAVARELDEGMRRERLRATLFDPHARDLRLYLRGATLVFRLHPDRGQVLLLEAADPPEGAHTLRALMIGARAPADDRRIDLAFVRERGAGPARFTLSIHLRPGRWDATAWDADGGTVFARLAGDVSGAPAAFDEGPPPREGLDEPVTPERWVAVLEAAGEDLRERRRALLRSMAWTSPVNADALVALDPSESYRVWLSLRETSGGQPVLLTEESPAQPYPMALPGEVAEPVKSLLDAMAESASETEEGDVVALGLSPELLAAAEREIERLERRLRALERERDVDADPESIRAIGDLILARYGEVRAGAASVVLTGFEGEEVVVELDPGLPPHENADRYYSEAQRIERALRVLPGRIREAEDRLGEAKAVLDRARAGELDESALSAMLPERAAGRGGDAGGPTLPYRTFRSAGGLEIRVGRGRRWNDDLTFHHARPGDVWLHARQAPGAHVILRWDSEDAPPARDLHQAAVLAAVHSKARTSGSVAVDWTRRRYVRKPRKAPPGAVVPERVQTLFVEPDEALAERLAERD